MTVESTERPLVTFALFAYNQENFITDALIGALQQTYSPLEIIISDDHSVDSTFDLITQHVSDYRGPHEIVLVRNERNLGIVRHVDALMQRARGDLVVLAAGDDVSMPDRVSRIFIAYKESGYTQQYFHSAATLIDRQGNRIGSQNAIGLENFRSLTKAALSTSLALGATQAWTRSFYAAFPPMRPSVWAEDLIMGFRACLLGAHHYIEEPLVYYRVDVGVTAQTPSQSGMSRATSVKRNNYILQQRAVDCMHVRKIDIAILCVSQWCIKKVWSVALTFSERRRAS